MAPYFILVGVPLFIRVFQNFKVNKLAVKKNYDVIVFFIILFFLLALRDDSIGIDLKNYIPFFKKIGRLDWAGAIDFKHYELGYRILNKISYSISSDPQVFLGIVGAICCIPTAILYYKESENGILSVLLYITATSIFDLNFSGLRQAITIALTAPAFYLVKHKKWMFFILLVAFASLFHKSAWIILLLYPIYHLKIAPGPMFTGLVPISLFTFIFKRQIANIIIPLLGDDYSEKYSNSEESGAVTMIILLALFVIFSYLVPDEKEMDETTRGLRNILSAALIFQMFAPVNNVAMRFNYYFLLFVPLVIPRIINRWKGGRKNDIIITKFVLILFFLCYFFYKIYYSNDILEVYPYKAYWS